MRGTLASLLASIAGARMTADAAFDGVSTDSRSVPAGALFVALRGERFDAHDFLPQVGERGVAAVIAEQLPPGFALPALVVPDSLVALGQLANHWRRGFTLPLIGVTGSNGKTTVKEMIAAILAAAHGENGRLATRGNLNNEIGVPLTLFRLGAEHRAAVVELGMNHPGEIGRLATIAAPTIGLVNNAQREHQEFMHTVEAVALENGAVFAGLAPGGIAVYPADDEFTPLWQGLAAGHTSVTFGFNDTASVSCTHQASAFGSQLDVIVRFQPSRAFRVNLAAAGLHNVRNALAAIACTLAAGIEVDAIVAGLEAFAPVNGRLQRHTAANGATVIDDSYNANPDSVRAAIDVLAQAAAPRILVLGDMGEVGTQGREFHEEIAAYAVKQGIGTVLVTGELTRHMHGASIQHIDQLGDLLVALDAHLHTIPGAVSNATVLVKGSRFMKMERVVQHLLGTNNTGKEAH
jgi:UDP-N-acetylmuramoyl-tripeptide--D-alanyl-D-alanine ligase